jgi:hypothetical protein
MSRVMFGSILGKRAFNPTLIFMILVIDLYGNISSLILSSFLYMYVSLLWIDICTMIEVYI